MMYLISFCLFLLFLFSFFNTPTTNSSHLQINSEVVLESNAFYLQPNSLILERIHLSPKIIVFRLFKIRTCGPQKRDNWERFCLWDS